MSTWWYLEKNQKVGPIEGDELKRRLQGGSVTGASMVWKEGMDLWTPLEQVPELDGLRAVVPPPVPQKDIAQHMLERPVAGAGRRFFARIFDLWWESLLLGWCSGYLLGQVSPGFITWIGKPGSSELFALLLLPFAFLLDAIVFAVFRNTPGKALLRLSVTDGAGERLSFARYIGRNAAVWGRGLAFGIPIVNLVAMYRQSSRLSKTGQAAYDADTGVFVRAAPAGFLRTSAFVLLAFALLIGIGVMNVREREREREHREAREEKLYVWQNPQTSMNASIASIWRYAQDKNEDGQQIFTFTELNNRAVVVIAAEQAPALSMGNYIAALQEGQKTTVSYKDGGRFVELDGRPSWQGSGVVVGETSNVVDVRVTQIGADYWRVVSVQAPPYDYSNELVAQLKRELWKTVVRDKPRTTS